MVRGWFLGIVPIAGKALQMQKKLKIFLPIFFKQQQSLVMQQLERRKVREVYFFLHHSPPIAYFK